MLFGLGGNGEVMKIYRHGIIGMGNISSDHIKGMEAIPQLGLYAICEPNEALLHEKGDLFGIPLERRFRSSDELLKQDDVDSISICTPNHTHTQLVKESLRHRKPFAVEKPLSLSLTEAEQLKSIIDKDPLPHMLCFSYRFMPAARYARWIVQNGQIGQVQHIYCQYLQGWGNDAARPLTWRFRKEFCGTGALGDLGSHIIDLTRFIAGDFESVYAQSGVIMPRRPLPENPEQFGDVDVDDYTHFLTKMRCGATGMYAFTRFAYGWRNLQTIHIYGSKGGIVYSQDLIDGKLQDHLHACIGDVSFRSNTFTELHIPMEHRLTQMEAFAKILSGNKHTMAATIEDGYNCEQVMDAVQRSAQSESWVSCSKA